MERRARGAKAQRARDAYVATPAFTLVTDDGSALSETPASTTPPLLRVKTLPRATNVNKYWFNPSWIAESERPDVEHGEFQSPVWLAVEMTMHSDRDRERYETDFSSTARHAAAEPGTGQLRSMLALVSGARHADAAAPALAPITYIHQGRYQCQTERHVALPRPAASTGPPSSQVCSLHFEQLGKSQRQSQLRGGWHIYE